MSPPGLYGLSSYVKGMDPCPLMFSELQYDSMAQLRDTEHEPCQRDVHPGITSVHCFPATFSDGSGGGRAVMVPVAISEHTREFLVHFCAGMLCRRERQKTTRTCTI